ncbi:MAG: mechanosensitive ion channel [Bdellovibrionota bacterium]
MSKVINLAKHLIFFSIIFFAGQQLAVSQEPQATSVEQVKVDKENSPITINNLVGEIEKLTRLQDELSVLLEESKKQDFYEKYKSITESLDDKIGSLKNGVEDKLAFTSDELDELEAPVIDVRKKLESLAEKVKVSADEFSLYVVRFKKSEARWSAALKTFVSDNESPAIRSKITEALKNVRELKAKAEKRLDSLVLTQTKIAETSTQIRKVKEAVSVARARFQEALLIRESLPMYSFHYWSELLLVPSGLMGSNLLIKFDKAVRYLQQSSNQNWVFLIAVVLIALVIRSIRKSELAKQSFKTLYDNPILLTIVTSLIVARFIYYDSTIEVIKLFDFLLVLPIIVFLIDILGKKYADVILGIGIVYVLGEFRVLLRNDIVGNQFLLLLQILLSIYLSRRFIKDCRCVGELDSPELSKSLLLLGQVGRVFQVAFSITACLLVLGFYRLTLFLEDPLFNSIYSALALFVAYRLAYGFFIYFVHSELTKSFRFIHKNREYFQSVSQVVLFLIACSIWLYEVLDSLNVAETTVQSLKNFFLLGFSIGDFEIQVGGILLAIFFFTMAGRISAGIRSILEADVYSRKNLSAGTRNTIDTGLHYVILIMAMFAAIGSLGIGMQNLAIIAGALSVGIGFGLQNIVNNFVSGIILLFERPIKVGDLVLTGDSLGNVSRIGIRSSTIRTLDAAEIIIPNATLVTNNVINWTHTNSRARISVAVGVAYGSDLESVIEVLTNVLNEQDYVLEYPAPDVLFKSFGDSSLNFEARGWIKNVQDRPKIQSDMTLAIHNALKKAGITIPFPQRDVHIYKTGSSE